MAEERKLDRKKTARLLCLFAAFIGVALFSLPYMVWAWGESPAFLVSGMALTVAGLGLFMYFSL